MLTAMGVCHCSSAALAARYQLASSAKIEHTSPGFAGGELLRALNKISAHQQTFLRTLRDRMSELICGGLNLLGKLGSTDLSRTPDMTPCCPTGKSRSKLTRMRSQLTQVSPQLPRCFGAALSCDTKPASHNPSAFSRISYLDSQSTLKIPLHL